MLHKIISHTIEKLAGKHVRQLRNNVLAEALAKPPSERKQKENGMIFSHLDHLFTLPPDKRTQEEQAFISHMLGLITLSRNTCSIRFIENRVREIAPLPIDRALTYDQQLIFDMAERTYAAQKMVKPEWLAEWYIHVLQSNLELGVPLTADQTRYLTSILLHNVLFCRGREESLAFLNKHQSSLYWPVELHNGSPFIKGGFARARDMRMPPDILNRGPDHFSRRTVTLGAHIQDEQIGCAVTLSYEADRGMEVHHAIGSVVADGRYLRATIDPQTWRISPN